MSNVYLTKFNGTHSPQQVCDISKQLLEKIIEKENLHLEKTVPLKVHFGEKGNATFIKPENYDGVIDFLEKRKIASLFIETNVMYGGQRCNQTLHLKTAQQHGFTRLPVVIADGEHGENYQDVEINKKHFKKCKLGKGFEPYNQLIVIAHFKGHMLAGFGGAMKQLAMGFASKGGKMAQHLGMKPKIKSKLCKKCMLCTQRCAENAITISDKSSIDYTRCVGCAACVSICPHKAISIFSFKSILRMIGIGNPFQEKIAEYAYAAHQSRKNIYLNFIMNVTAGCDCEPRKMKILVPDIGILASLDPVAIDQACHDLVKHGGKEFGGQRTLRHAEKIGLGSRKYNLIQEN